MDHKEKRAETRCNIRSPGDTLLDIRVLRTRPSDLERDLTKIWGTDGTDTMLLQTEQNKPGPP